MALTLALGLGWGWGWLSNVAARGLWPAKVLQKFNGLIGISVTAFTSVSDYKMTRINVAQHYTFDLPCARLPFREV